jgi:hypothetical protein
MSEANTTALHAASGRRAHQMCNVEICPCRIDFSRDDCSETSFKGKATSMRRFSMIRILLLTKALLQSIRFALLALPPKPPSPFL